MAFEDFAPNKYKKINIANNENEALENINKLKSKIIYMPVIHAPNSNSVNAYIFAFQSIGFEVKVLYNYKNSYYLLKFIKRE